MFENTVTSQVAPAVQRNEEEFIDVKKIIGKLLKNWLLFAISVIICLILAFTYKYYASPNWHVSSKILVKDQKNSPQSVAGGSLNGDLGSLFNVKSNADNEIQILKSRSLMQSVVRNMQLNVRTYRQESLRKREIFQDSPFAVSISYKADTLLLRSYKITILNNKEFSIENDKENVNAKVRYGETVKLPQYNLKLNYVANVPMTGKYLITIESPDVAVYGFANNFTASLSDKQATSIDLGFSYPNPAKGEAILNKLMQLYLLSNIQYEKQIADSTMAFIDSRIILVSNELTNIEKQFENYKTRNNIANISEQSKALVNSASEYYDKLAQQEAQLTVINDLQRYLNNPQNKNVIPSSLLNPVDQSFGQAINGYNELLLSRDKALLSYTNDNPIVQNIDQQLNNSRLNLLNNIETYRKSLVAGKKQLEKQNSGFSGQLRTLPGKERNYLDFARQQNLKQELYLFLLQKREETAISRNSTISSSRIIDLAKSDFEPYKPKGVIIYIIGLIAGLVLPAGFLLIRDLLNVRIDDKSDITSATTVSILGEIGHNSDKHSLVTGTNSRSVISEQFRSLRTNLQFVLDSSRSNVILFTSSMSGEGKSFLSLNLGSALALTGKKVVFMEMDLRKPKLSESVGLGIDNGFTNYAISEDVNYDFKKLLKPLAFSNNCQLISSGPIPPNPSELLESGKFEKLVTYLKSEFDYVIIDCAPVGLVTDALTIAKHADITLYVTRQGFTYKSQLQIVNDLLYTKKVKGFYLIVNDIKAEKAGYSSYRLSYGYGLDEDAGGVWKKIFKK